MSNIAFAEAIEEARLLVQEGADGETLYRCWFHHDTGEFATWPSGAAYRAGSLDPARLERGWCVVELAEGAAGAVVVTRGAVRRLVVPPEVTPEDPRRLSFSPGDAVLVDPLASAETGGFAHVWSAGWQENVPARLQRLYCRTEPACASDLMARVVARAPAGAPWAMKALSGVHDRGRRDDTLLYLPTDTAADAGWMADVMEELRAMCRGELPPFVTPLSPGIGRAPDPGGDRSFGQAVADAMASAAPHAHDVSLFRAAAMAAVLALPGMGRPAGEGAK